MKPINRRTVLKSNMRTIMKKKIVRGQQYVPCTVDIYHLVNGIFKTDRNETSKKDVGG